MSATEFTDAALILVAHGSTVNAGSGASAFLQAAELRRRGLFGEVAEAFWKQEPSIAGALRGVFARRVFVVPFCISEGWFTKQVIPSELGLGKAEDGLYLRVQARDDRILHYCRAVGSHPTMTEVLLGRAADVVARYPFPRAPRPADTSLLIAGHGTGYSRGSFESIERQVRLIRERGLFAEVHGVFLEEAPLVRDAWTLATSRSLVLVPFFLGDGLHTREDIPVLLGESADRVAERLRRGQPTWRNPTERQGRRLWLAEAVGTDPRLADVIVERVREAASAAHA
jgi:sirohydrochlorin cobaltochelatase